MFWFVVLHIKSAILKADNRLYIDRKTPTFLCQADTVKEAKNLCKKANPDSEVVFVLKFTPAKMKSLALDEYIYYLEKNIEEYDPCFDTSWENRSTEFVDEMKMWGFDPWDLESVERYKKFREVWRMRPAK